MFFIEKSLDIRYFFRCASLLWGVHARPHKHTIHAFIVVSSLLSVLGTWSFLSV